jgi:hypothetical protein
VSYRLAPAASLERGLPSIGFEMKTPNAVEVTPIGGGPTVVRCCERKGGKTIGELEVTIFKAALIIDRDGILEEKANAAANDAAEASGGPRARVLDPIPVSLPGASGFRADVEMSPRNPLPYLYLFAIASHDLGVEGGVLVTVRCATPEWDAANDIMKSLRILTRRSRTANDSDEAPPVLPMIGRRED